MKISIPFLQLFFIILFVLGHTPANSTPKTPISIPSYAQEASEDADNQPPDESSQEHEAFILMDQNDDNNDEPEKGGDDQPSDIADKATAYLFYAIAQGNEQAVRGLLDQGASVNKQYGSKGDTALIYAIRALQALVANFENKIFLDHQTFVVAYMNRFAIIRILLLRPDTNITIENNNKETALLLATQEGLKDVIELITQKTQTAFVATLNESDKYKQKSEDIKISEEVRVKIMQAIEKAQSNIGSPHESTISNEHLKLIFSLPWDKETKEEHDLVKIKQSLDASHYGLKKVKEEVEDYIATRILQEMTNTPHDKSPIICLVGPPGVGKTTFAQSIAKALNKDFCKISLGGVRDESAIRGNRKVYVGAEPGSILKELRFKSKNAVMLLDEIDKLGEGLYQQSPVGALLEVLDPSQNKNFVDHYLDIPFDLSKILFITTANTLDTVPPALLDRLKIIYIPSYTQDEKLVIANKYILPSLKKKMGLESTGLTINDEVILHVIKHYTYESGVRTLERHLTTLCAKAARMFLENKQVPTFTPDNLPDYLGASFDPDADRVFLQQNSIGISNGLAWTSNGGALFIVEASLIPGKGDIKITGQLQSVAKESVEIAYSYVRAHAQELGISQELFEKNSLHIHCPAGAIKKDGPSAGIAILSAITSLYSKKRFDASFAMTGELSLTGHVLPIGGLKEKLFAAKRLGINKVIIPKANKTDLVEIQDVVDGMVIIPVSHASEVLNMVLLPG